MLRSLIPCVWLCLLVSVDGIPQTLTQTAVSTAPYHHPSEDKESWQRLNLWLSSTFLLSVKDGQVDLDSTLLLASRSLGMSRISILAEGIDDTELLTQSKWIDQQDPAKAIRQLTKTTGRKRIETLVLLGAYYAFQPGVYYHYKDSVEYFLTKAITESNALKEEKLARQAFCLLGKIYVQANDKKGDSVFNQLISQCQATGDKETEARAYAYRGIFTPASRTTVLNKITDLQKAAGLYHSLNNTEGEINAVTDIGYLQIITGQLQLANESLLKALQLLEAIHFPYTHYNTDALVVATTFQGKFGEPLKYILQTIKVAESNRDSIGWGYFYSRLSSLYLSEDNNEKAGLANAQKAVKRFTIDRNPAVYNILNDLVIRTKPQRMKEALTLIQDISKKVNTPVTFTDQLFYHLVLTNIYRGMNKMTLAERHLSKMDSLETKAEAIRGPLRRALINDLSAEIYLSKGQYLKARENLEKHFTFPASPQRLLGFDLSTYRKLIYVDSALQDRPSALVHYRKYTLLMDSSFKVAKRRQAEELQVMYQTEEKENQITSLNEQSKLEQANLKQATLVRNMTIAGIIAVVIIAILLYRQSRLRKMNNAVVTHQNEQLQRFLTEKEWLLKEIHHRVKNNLQIVMSLLNSQSAYIDNEPARIAIHDSQHRVHAMSLIHQKLYNSENVSSIDISLYIRELVSYLADSFNTGQRIRFEYNIEPVEMDVSEAVPLGLILNEAITNAIKYAFPDDRNGVIGISLSHTDPGQCLLSISDNGIGMQSHLKNKKAGSLGMSLMEGLSEDLDGNFSIESNDGTTIKVLFGHSQRLTSLVS